MAEKNKPTADELAKFQKRAADGVREFDKKNSGGAYLRALKTLLDTFGSEAFADKTKKKKK